MNSSLHPLQFSEVLLKSQLKDEGNSNSLYIFLTIDSRAFTSPFKYSRVSKNPPYSLSATNYHTPRSEEKKNY